MLQKCDLHPVIEAIHSLKKKHRSASAELLQFFYLSFVCGECKATNHAFLLCLESCSCFSSF